MARLSIVDLFAGTGGMGLAALCSDYFRHAGRIVWTAELDPRYVNVINRNYVRFAKSIGKPSQVPKKCLATDLAKLSALRAARKIKEQVGRIDLMLAGPPCQGFSLANRLSRNHKNPQNALSLVVTRYVRALRPRLLILENVPGIRTVRTGPRKADTTTTDILQRRLRRLGYQSEVILLNARDYGVPQSRLRSFLVAARDVADRSRWERLVPPASHGPGHTKDYVTVSDALGDLPPIPNGCCELTTRYGSPARTQFQRTMRRHTNGVVSDHLTSRHSEYVLKRYARIPQGGNWQAIESMMTNYQDASRTHLNIYQRLKSDEPARTIGNFRKSMTVHPSQDRGLSLREAARLQSIPDWISFADPEETATRDVVPGLNAYQQQIGNAVSYLLTEALVSHVACLFDL